MKFEQLAQKIVDRYKLPLEYRRIYWSYWIDMLDESLKIDYHKDGKRLRDLVKQMAGMEPSKVSSKVRISLYQKSNDKPNERHMPIESVLEEIREKKKLEPPKKKRGTIFSKRDLIVMKSFNKRK